MTSLRESLSGILRVRGWPLGVYFLLLVGLFVVAAGSTAVYVRAQTERDGRRAAVADARFAAHTAAKELGEQFALVQATAGQLASNPQITQVFDPSEPCSLTFGGVGGPDRSHLDIVRADGTVACTSRPETGTPARYDAADWMQRALARPLFLAPTIDPATGVQVAISAAPIAGRKGAVIAFVELASIGPHLATLYGGASPVEFLITSSDGRSVIARSIDPGRWVGASLAGTPFARAENSVERKDLNGTPRLWGDALVPGVGWRFYVGEDKSAALAAGSRLERRQLEIISVGLLAVLLAAWLVYRTLVSPIRRLSAGLRATTAQPVPGPVPVSGPAEIVALGQDVNCLISSINRELLEREKAEAQARAVLEAALDAVITIDHEGRILEFNRSAELMFGHRRADVLGTQMFEVLVPPSLRADHERGLARYLETHEGQVIGKRVEIAALRADGTEFPVELAITRVSLDGPAVFTGFVRDISERKHAEVQLRELAAIVESSRDAIVGRTLDGAITSWNAAAEQLFGYSAREMVGQSFRILAPSEQSSELDAINAQLARREVVAPFETVRVRKDGTRIQVESTISPVVDPSGRVIGASSISRDVTERRRVDAALRTSEARYRDLFENATDLIATVDLESRLTAVNQAFVQTLGYTREELIGRPLRELVPPESHERLDAARVRKLDEEVSGTIYEHELIAKDGHRIQVEVGSRVIEEDGRAVGVEAICRDITERRNLEEQLRQAQRLEAIGRLAGGIAHDFNNLLTVISGYSDALLEERDPASEPELKEIAAAAERATILTRQLLAFSRRQVLQPRVVDLNEIVEGITPMLTRLIGEDIDLVTSLDPTVDHVVADPSQIEQVLTNLVINARDAMPEGGKLTIETGNADLDEDYVAEHPEARLGAHAALAVSDNGVGMDADTLAHVFEPFFTTKAGGSGTGLGLSTVYGIVKQSGGNTWVYSEPGRGSTFKVYLPATQKETIAMRAEPTEIVTPVGAETILIVEDEESVRSLATRMLRTRGYTVHETGSTAEAIRLAENGGTRIDLLLTDLVMPEMNGRELAEEMIDRIPNLRVLFMSGYADEAVMRSGNLDMGSAYLEKPFSASDLAHKVRDILDGGFAADRKHVA